MPPYLLFLSIWMILEKNIHVSLLFNDEKHTIQFKEATLQIK